MMGFYFRVITDMWRCFKRYADCKTEDEYSQAIGDFGYIAETYISFGIPKHTEKFVTQIAIALLDEIGHNLNENLAGRG